MRLSLGASMASFGCLVVIGLLLLSGIVGAFLWPYSLNAWLVFFGKQPNVVWWHGFVLGITPYFGQASIPVAIITWILMMVIV